MTKAPTPNWQPISMLPLLANLLNQQLDDVRHQRDTLLAVRTKPHALDDATMDRVIASYGEQREFMLFCRAQATRWFRDAKTQGQRTSVERFSALLRQVDAALGDVLALAAEISAEIIDKILGGSDTDLACALPEGDIPFPDTRKYPALPADERLKIATVLDLQRQDLIEEKCDEMTILAAMREYMVGFKRLMDAGDQDELNRLLDQFPGLQRFATMLESLAGRMQSGQINVPK